MQFDRFGYRVALNASALLAALVTLGACAGRAPMPKVAPMPCLRANRFWRASAESSSPRRVGVWLDVWTGTDGNWRMSGGRRLDVALAAWNAIGLPVRLAREARRESAQIRVVVITRLPRDGRDASNTFGRGETEVRFLPSGEISGATIVIAERTPLGVAFSSADQDATLLHELGHALGIPHGGGALALMATYSIAKGMTPADVSLARAVYSRNSCPAGGPISARRE